MKLIAMNTPVPLKGKEMERKGKQPKNTMLYLVSIAHDNAGINSHHSPKYFSFTMIVLEAKFTLAEDWERMVLRNIYKMLPPKVKGH